MLPRNLFIIVEGPDNVGKSTLIQNLKNYYHSMPFHTMHYSNVRQETPEEVQIYSKRLYTQMFDIMVNQMKYGNSGIIFDRSHLGEMVYGPIYRGYTGEYVLDIEKQYMNILDVWNNLLLITLVDTPENLIAREDGLSFTTDLGKKQIEIGNFMNAASSSNIKHKILINIQSHDEKKVLAAVAGYIEQNMKGLL
jgi:thymidylate kinase